MRLRAVLLLSLCSGCNALTGASELEPVACIDDCADAVAADTSEPRDTATDTAKGNDTATAEDSAMVMDETPSTGCQPKMARITVGFGGYCIDMFETTNAEYKAFLDSSPRPDGQPTQCAWNTTFVPSAWPYIESRANFPVRWVDWCDAHAYCAWKGKRLCGKIGGGAAPIMSYNDPATNEWYRACTVAGAHVYPYGDTLNAAYCNSQTSGYGIATNVGSLPKCTNEYGTFDMSGNVSEWEDSCTATMGASDVCRTRGGSWNSADPKCAFSEGSARQTATEMIGIRCCDE